MGLVHLRKWMKNKYYAPATVFIEAEIIKGLLKRGEKNDVGPMSCRTCRHYEGKRDSSVGVVGFCRLSGRKVMMPYVCPDWERW